MEGALQTGTDSKRGMGRWRLSCISTVLYVVVEKVKVGFFTFMCVREVMV